MNIYDDKYVRVCSAMKRPGEKSGLETVTQEAGSQLASVGKDALTKTGLKAIMLPVS